jgi:hypothetical protein
MNLINDEPLQYGVSFIIGNYIWNIDRIHFKKQAYI